MNRDGKLKKVLRHTMVKRRQIQDQFYFVLLNGLGPIKSKITLELLLCIHCDLFSSLYHLPQFRFKPQYIIMYY